MLIIRNRWIWYVFSGTLIGASIVFIALWQFKFGIDFTGGSLLDVEYREARPAIESVQKLGDLSVQPVGDKSFLIRTKPLSETDHQKLLRSLEDLGKLDERRFDSIGPTIGEELRNKAISAVVIVFIAIVIYIAWAFRRVSRPVSSWKYGIITTLTALHDVIIPLGLFALLGHLMNIEVGGAFVAAILTIMGYSINDTIVVLDRVRENLSKTRGSFEEIVERSVHQSFARSLNTTITTLLALIAIYFFGGESVKFFALALIAGIATGAYSSLFIAAPLLVSLESRKRV